MLNVQGGASLPAAAAQSLSGMRSSSLQQSKGTTTLAAPQEQAAPGQPLQEAMEEDTAHSPVAEHQVMVSFAWPNLLSMYIVAEFQLEVVVLDQLLSLLWCYTYLGTPAHVNC